MNKETMREYILRAFEERQTIGNGGKRGMTAIAKSAKNRREGLSGTQNRGANRGYSSSGPAGRPGLR